LSEIAKRLEATLRRPAKSTEDASTAAGNAKTTGEQAAPEPPGPQLEPDTQDHGDEKAASEPAALPGEPETRGLGDDKASSEPAAPPREEPDTQGRGDDKGRPPSPPNSPAKEQGSG